MIIVNEVERRQCTSAPQIIGHFADEVFLQQSQRAQQSTAFAALSSPLLECWLGSRVVSVLDSGAEERGFKSQPRRRRVTNSLRQTVHQAAKLAAALLRFTATSEHIRFYFLVFSVLHFLVVGSVL